MRHFEEGDIVRCPIKGKVYRVIESRESNSGGWHDCYISTKMIGTDRRIEIRLEVSRLLNRLSLRKIGRIKELKINTKP